MATAEYVLQTLTDVEQHIEMLITVTNPGEIVRAANHYLATWSKDRIENLQKIDGGWGPFDSQKRPESIHGVGHIARISNVLSNHCRALEDAGIDATPEILELDLYFALAKEIGDNFIASSSRFRTGTSPQTGYRRWSDNDAVATRVAGNGRAQA